MNITAYDLASRFVGIKEVAGNIDNPQIGAMLSLDINRAMHDETPWCSAFVNYVCWLLRLPRSKSLMARSWLNVGAPIRLVEAKVGFDIVVLDRPPNPASGHVGFFAGWEPDLARDQPGTVLLLGGNQGDGVSIASFPAARIIGVRRLA